MGLDNINAMIANVEFFSICNDEQIRLLAFASEMQRYNARDIIAKDNVGTDGAYIINQGTVLINDDKELDKKPYFISGPNKLIGERSLLLNRPLRSVLIASDNVEALFVPQKAFFKLLRQYPEMAALIAKRIEENLDNYLRSFDGLR
ncbi:MAG: cyclic nucleotide-binding domain-containing protein [Devosiaceae bacterium]|nr:cyclic nucleotide-binding domain-containing protein [Devosiaceae bacterium]